MAATGGKTEEDARKATTLVPLYQLVAIPMMVVGFVCIFAMKNYTGAMDKVGLTLALESMPWPLVGLMGPVRWLRHNPPAPVVPVLGLFLDQRCVCSIWLGKG